MKIYAVDDEPLILESLRRTIQEAAPEAALQCFSNAPALMDALRTDTVPPDIIFSDIEMPGMDGLELAAALKEQAPDMRLVFVTGYSQYALEAYRRHVDGYVMKPVTTERIREELAMVRPIGLRFATGGRLKVRCFGAFEVFWQGAPLQFARRKTKELLAYLVDRRGELCTAGEIIAALWEEGGDPASRKAYLRNLTADLRTVLAEIGMEELLIRRNQQWAVRPEYLDCDYYRVLAGDREAFGLYHGEYMTRYSWAEGTAADIFFRMEAAGEL